MRDFNDVNDLLAAACGPALPAELAGEAEALAAFAAAGPQPAAERRPLLARLRTRKALVAAAVGGFTLFSGLTAAGALPGAAQQAASDALAKIGITVPAPDDHAGDHPGARGQSADDHGSDAADGGADAPDAADSGQGAEISETARTTDATGVDKGAEISTVASDGKSQAGEDHTAPTTGDDASDAADEHKPADTPPTSTPPAQADDGMSHKPADGSHP